MTQAVARCRAGKESQKTIVQKENADASLQL